MKKKLHLLLVAMLLQVTLGMAQGAESALNFDGTDNLIQLSSPLTVGSSSHTFELPIWLLLQNATKALP